MDKMSLGLEGGPFEFIGKFVPGERADRDWTPSSGLLPQGFSTLNHSQWITFRDSQGLDGLIELSVSLQPGRVTYSPLREFDSRNVFSGPTDRVSVILRWKYVIQTADNLDDRYTALSLPALDLYHWLYLITIDAKERQNSNCELSESIRMKLDGLTMWSTVVPRLFVDVSLQTLEHRLLAALVSRSAPLPIQMLRDTASILYNTEPAMICQLRPFFFTCFIKASHGAMYDSLASRGQRNKEDVD
ncbi:hypothetical protein PQX77_009789 [Marasmius sp. AFHP31]|nr:hypothetical protein PQX77_009789 [Marasmius sp. AFHP31]